MQSPTSHEFGFEPSVNVAVLGAGTGTSTVLSGMKHFAREGLTAIVNSFDDGGGTGNLRNEYPDLPAPGDWRQCMDAMSFAPDEAREVLRYRFGEGKNNGDVTLKGQNEGNLLITGALLKHKMDITKALKVVGSIFQISGQVIPPTNENLRLVFELANGEKIYGEHAAEQSKIPSFKGAKIGFNKGRPSLSEDAELAIYESDFVVIAPGDPYTSVGPVLAVRGMKEALKRKPVIQVSNLMNRKNLTRGMSALDISLEYERILGNEDGKERIIDRVIYNTEKLDPEAVAYQLKKWGSRPVRPNVKGLRNYGFNPVGRELLSNAVITEDPNDPLPRGGIRHDPRKVTNAILGIYYSNGFANKNDMTVADFVPQQELTPVQ